MSGPRGCPGSGSDVATLAQEFAHELLHQTCRRQTTRRMRETEAEAVAFVVCQLVGLETNTASRDSIHLHGGDAETLAPSLDAIQKTATLINQRDPTLSRTGPVLFAGAVEFKGLPCGGAT